jgi:hypothetical protein
MAAAADDHEMSDAEDAGDAFGSAPVSFTDKPGAKRNREANSMLAHLRNSKIAYDPKFVGSGSNPQAALAMVTGGIANKRFTTEAALLLGDLDCGPEGNCCADDNDPEAKEAEQERRNMRDDGGYARWRKYQPKELTGEKGAKYLFELGAMVPTISDKYGKKHFSHKDQIPGAWQAIMREVERLEAEGITEMAQHFAFPGTAETHFNHVRTACTKAGISEDDVVVDGKLDVDDLRAKVDALRADDAAVVAKIKEFGGPKVTLHKVPEADEEDEEAVTKRKKAIDENAAAIAAATSSLSAENQAELKKMHAAVREKFYKRVAHACKKARLFRMFMHTYEGESEPIFTEDGSFAFAWYDKSGKYMEDSFDRNETAPEAGATRRTKREREEWWCKKDGNKRPKKTHRVTPDNNGPETAAKVKRWHPKFVPIPAFRATSRVAFDTSSGPNKRRKTDRNQKEKDEMLLRDYQDNKEAADPNGRIAEMLESGSGRVNRINVVDDDKKPLAMTTSVKLEKIAALEKQLARVKAPDARASLQNQIADLESIPFYYTHRKHEVASLWVQPAFWPSPGCVTCALRVHAIQVHEPGDEPYEKTEEGNVDAAFS